MFAFFFLKNVATKLDASECDQRQIALKKTAALSMTASRLQYVIVRGIRKVYTLEETSLPHPALTGSNGTGQS